MSNAVKTADPSALELDEVFKAAMEGPAKPRVADAPAEIDRDAPHGRDDEGAPLAPYGWTKPVKKGDSSRPRLTRGRPSKDDEARTGTIIPPSQPDKGKPAADLDADYSEGLGELADALWFGLTGLGMFGSKIPIVGRFLPEEKLAAEAYVFRANKDKLCGALSLSAKHNASAARFCARATQGEVTWVATAAFMVMPFAGQTAAVLRGAQLGEREVEADDGTITRAPIDTAFLAQQNSVAVDQFVADMQAAAQAQQAEVSATLNGNRTGGNHHGDQPV
jgi:hypothetical protein